VRTSKLGTVTLRTWIDKLMGRPPKAGEQSAPAEPTSPGQDELTEEPEEQWERADRPSDRPEAGGGFFHPN
jgi:hypothetical protein